jgi:ABC-2 type transport system permease protein
MFWTIARHESRLLRSERTATGVLVLFCVLGGYAVAGGLQRATARGASTEQALREQQTTLRTLRADIETEEEEARRTHAAAGPGVEYGPRDPDYVLGTVRRNNVVLPASPYEVLASGRSEMIPAIYSVMTLEIAINPYTDALPSPGKLAIFGRAVDIVSNPLRLRAGAFDLLFLVVYLCPLLIIALCYDLLSAERDNGTLAMVLAQPVRLRTLLGAKIAVRAIMVALALVILPVMAIAVGTGFSLPGDLTRLALWIAISLSYAMVWFALGVAVNAVGRSSAFNAVALALLWIALVVVLPALVSLTAVVRHRVPDRIELVNEIRAARNAARVAANEEVLRREFLQRHAARIYDQASMLAAMRTIREAAPTGNLLLEPFFERHPDIAGDRQFTQTELFYVLLAAQEEEVERRTQPLRDRIAGALLAQRRWLEGAAMVLPPLVVEQRLRDIADTSDRRYQHFFDLAAEYQRQQRAFFWPRVARTVPIDRADANRIPSFSYQHEPLSMMMRRVMVALAVLAAAAMAVAAAGATAYRRFTVA